MITTIGTSNRSAAAFNGPLAERRVTAIVDVRSKHTSRMRHFHSETLKAEAVQHGMRYGWAGEHLSGLSYIRTDHADFSGTFGVTRQLAAQSQVGKLCAQG